MIYLLITFAISWGLVFFTTPIILRIASKTKLFDLPSWRKIHERPTVRLGGLAIFFAFIIPFVAFYFYVCHSLNLSLLHIVQKAEWLGLLSGAFIIFLTGFIDDIKGLSPWTKLFLQLSSGLVTFLGGLSIEKIFLPLYGTVELPYYAALGITIFWFVLIINGLNLIDGIDGLAAGTAFICGFFLLIVCFQSERYYMALPALMLTGSTLGFLHYNINPARIFMGDSGSYFLGYTLAAIAIKVTRNENGVINIMVPFLILALPIIEPSMAVIRRLIKGANIFQPDKEHIHHCLLEKGLAPKTTAFLLYGVSFATGLVAISYNYVSSPLLITLAFLVLSLLGMLAHSVGYLDCLLNIDITTPIKSSSVDMLFRFSLRRDLSSLKKANTPDEIAQILSGLLSKLKLDRAKLTILIPPCASTEIVSSSEECLSHKVLLSLNLPLVKGAICYGSLMVEKNMFKRDFTEGMLLKYLEKMVITVVNRLEKIESDTPLKRSASLQEKTIPPVKKLTYTLIPQVSGCAPSQS